MTHRQQQANSIPADMSSVPLVSVAFVAPLRPVLHKRPRRHHAPSCVANLRGPEPSPPSPVPTFPPLAPLASFLPAALLAALLVTPSPALAKNLLSENTLFRRYLVTDSSAILRYALPLPSDRASAAAAASILNRSGWGASSSSQDASPPIREAQMHLEKLGVHMRSGGAAGIIAARRDVSQLRETLTDHQLDILLDIPARRRAQAAARLSQLEADVDVLVALLTSPDRVLGENVLPPSVVRAQQAVRDAFTPRNSIRRVANLDGAEIQLLRTSALNCVADIEEIAVEGQGLAFRIPRRYNNLPRLIGRAKVALTLRKGTGSFTDANQNPVGSDVTVVATLDGFSAPLTAGNFFDLVTRGYYNDTPVLASQRNFFAQLGERETDKTDGFVDLVSGERRTIPLEILAEGESGPAYGGTLDEFGIGDLQPVLPINAYGAMAMVHSVEDANDGSTQFYVFTLDPTSYTARSFGGSVLTGSLATFGYVENGKEYLGQVEKGDRLTKAEVLSGKENFRARGDS